MEANVGATDRQLRTALGAILGTVSLAVLGGVTGLPSVLSPVLGVLSAVLLGTAATGTCGLYTALGVDTCSMQSKNAR